MAQELRIGLGGTSGVRSPQLKLRVNGNDVYLAQDVYGAKGMKVSFHESGR
jgi:hypothetical protein